MHTEGTLRGLRAFSLGCSVILLAAAAVDAQDAETPSGAELLAPFKQELQQALREGMARGPDEAIAACKQRAPEIAEQLSRDGVRMGRTSHRLRNPANVAPAWVAPILETYQTSPDEREPRTVALDDSRSGYVEPILVQPMCLVCHGDHLDPALASRIKELYPADRAVGFAVGDLRGVFWVEFPRAQ